MVTDPGVIPEAYNEPTPIYTMCIQRSDVWITDRFDLALKYAYRFGYRGPTRGWEPTVVHHLNGDRRDNRSQNVVRMSSDRDR